MVPGTVAATVVRRDRKPGPRETNGGIAIVTNEPLRARAIQNPLAIVGAHTLAVRSKQRAQTQKSGQNPLGVNSRLQRYLTHKRPTATQLALNKDLRSGSLLADPKS